MRVSMYILPLQERFDQPLLNRYPLTKILRITFNQKIIKFFALIEEIYIILTRR